MEAMNPMGKMPSQVYTFPPLYFYYTQWIPRRDTDRVKEAEQWGLERILYSGMGLQLAAWASWLPRLEALHMICFSHQRESVCPKPLICFSHDLNLWVLLSVFVMDTKKFCTAVFLRWSYAVLRATGNTKHSPVPLGIPLATGTVPSACVEDNESSCALG